MDLNLVLPLHALLEEQSVTRAARVVGLSQPAMSHALGRLRSHFDDPLLVRSGRGMVATPMAQSLREPVRAAIERLELALATDPLDPATLSTTLRVVTDDHHGAMLLPRILAELQRAAPNVDVEVLPRGAPGRKRMLRDGHADLAIGYFSGAGRDLHRRALYDERWRCVVRRGHPLARRRTLERWARAVHLIVSPTGGKRGAVDDALETRGLERRVGATVPHFLVAFPIVEATDYVLTTPARLARLAAGSHAVTTFEPPIELDPFTIYMMWHPRTHHDSAHRWIRQRIAELAEAA